MHDFCIRVRTLCKVGKQSSHLYFLWLLPKWSHQNSAISDYFCLIIFKIWSATMCIHMVGMDLYNSLIHANGEKNVHLHAKEEALCQPFFIFFSSKKFKFQSSGNECKLFKINVVIFPTLTNLIQMKCHAVQKK